MAGTGTAHLHPDDDVVLRVEDLVVEFPVRGGTVQAVSGISFDVRRGETLGLVGESGCGKSTTGRAILQLPAPTSGSVRLGGDELTELSGEALRAVRPRLQMILQDPISSMNPRRTVHQIVSEGLDIWGYDGDRAALVAETLEAVGLDPDQVHGRRAHQFSGGQSQRICIARALVMRPEVLVCDEPVASLDVSVQAQIINLLEDLKQQHDLSLVFIAHDLAVVKSISDRIAVMYLGKLCEVAPSDEMFARPAHPYTRVLLESVPVPDPAHPVGRTELAGELPSPLDPPSGCRFRTRCPRATEVCAAEEPVLTGVGAGHFVACHHPHTVAATEPAELAVAEC